MAQTTRSYGTIPTLSSEFSTHALALLRRRHNASPNDHRQLDSGLKFKDIRRIKREVYETFPDCYVDWIERVNVPQMYGMYLLRKEEMQLAVNSGANGVDEMLLYHVTTKSRALESLKSGLDWRRTQRSRYGCGVSFSDDAEYADKYADNSTGEEVYEVNHKWNEGYNMIIPPGQADTTVSRDGCVYVKYNDFDFYPLHFVYYSYESDDYDDYDCDHHYDYDYDYDYDHDNYYNYY